MTPTTQPLTVEQLMAPRFLVTDPYPNNNDFPVGKIVEFEPWNTHYWQHSIKDCQGDRNWLTTFFETYPNIFKPIPWYSHRNKNELPEYLKATGFGKEFITGVVKVLNYGSVDHFTYEESGMINYGYLGWTLPATHTEYNEYINSLK